MGMDVWGKNPSGEAGEYFRANVWTWHPIAEYIEECAPSIYRECEYWHSNDGDGLNEVDSLSLAAVLRDELRSGRAAHHARTCASRHARPYSFTVEMVEEFANFLSECGGFEIC